MSTRMNAARGACPSSSAQTAVAAACCFTASTRALKYCTMRVTSGSGVVGTPASTLSMREALRAHGQHSQPRPRLPRDGVVPTHKPPCFASSLSSCPMRLLAILDTSPAASARGFGYLPSSALAGGGQRSANSRRMLTSSSAPASQGGAGSPLRVKRAADAMVRRRIVKVAAAGVVVVVVIVIVLAGGVADIVFLGRLVVTVAVVVRGGGSGGG